MNEQELTYLIEMHHALYVYGAMNYEAIRSDPDRRYYYWNLMAAIVARAEALGHRWFWKI